VPDLPTAILMERFYANLQDGLGRSEALRQAQFYTRDATVGQIKRDWLNVKMIERLSAMDRNKIDEETRDYLEWLGHQPDDYRPFIQPKCWGAFICQGEPGPLPSLRVR
jgi:CHAT domain-containing protein